MESYKILTIPVKLKGPNYLLWSRMVRRVLGGKGLWSHCLHGFSKEATAKESTSEGESGSKPVTEERWKQDDMLVLCIIQSSLEDSIMDAYSYCESAKGLWDTLSKVYGNLSNLSRVFEIKRVLSSLSQEEVEFTQHLGRYRALWSEMEMLRPQSIDPDVLDERREQDKVFALLLTLNPVYNDLIKHILRSDKLPTLEEVCAQVQKEEGSHGLFEAKETITMASHAESAPKGNKAAYKKEDRRNLKCEHCKRDGHTKERCWDLNPSLKPAKFK